MEPAGNEWLMAFPVDKDSTDRWDTSVNQALLKALDQAQDRVVMVWPWTPSAELDTELLVRFREVLERQCRLEIGWCHPQDCHQELLVKGIRQPLEFDHCFIPASAADPQTIAAPEETVSRPL